MFINNFTTKSEDSVINRSLVIGVRKSVDFSQEGSSLRTEENKNGLRKHVIICIYRGILPGG